MAHSSRTWSGARTPQAIKRVRQSERRHAIQQPRRTAAKTHISVALRTATEGDADATRKAVSAAISALENDIADPDFYARNPASFQKTIAALDKERKTLAAMEEEWLELEMLREELEEG